MPAYEYRCPECGDIEVWTSMGAAGAAIACPSCGRRARRLYSAPHTVRTLKPLARMLARAEKSRDEPEVVTAVPPGRPLPRRRARQGSLPPPAMKQLVGDKRFRELVEGSRGGGR